MTAGTTRLLTLAVQPLRAEDVDAVRTIDARIHPAPWSEQVWRTELADPTRTYLAARSTTAAGSGPATSRVLGYGGILLAVDEAHVTTIATDPDHRRRGVGSHLLVGLLQAAVHQGARAATLEVRSGNRDARRLYSRFGFGPVGVRPRYYAATDEDAIIMWVHDIHTASYAERLARLGGRLAGPGAAEGLAD